MCEFESRRPHQISAWQHIAAKPNTQHLRHHTHCRTDDDEQDDGQVRFQIHGPVLGGGCACGNARVRRECGLTLPCKQLREDLVPTARLELAQLSPLPPQDSVSTNFTTSAENKYPEKSARMA